MTRAMKDSGVAWIGEIPQGWAVVRGKDMLVERNKRSTHGIEELLSVSTYTGVKPRREMIDSEEALSRADSLVDYKKCYPGDIVINTMLAWNGSIGLSNHVGIVSPAYAVYQPRRGVDARFIEYLLRSDATLIKIRAESRGINDARLRLYPESLFAIQFGMPPLPEQRTIADYLDQQTALIDRRLTTLAEKKAVLAELRKATIHEAVTKGLNKAAPMKDSGVAWIGEIPANWEIRRFKDAGSFQTGKDHKALNEGYIPVYGSSREPFAFVDRALCKQKAIAIGRKGTIDQPYVIQAGFWAVDTCMFNTALKKNFSLEYLGYWAEIIPWREMSTQTALPSLTQTDANNAIVGFPPLIEQRAIADHLDQQTQQFDTQLATLDEQAQVLKELRKAIIHEAVTGKIDLSGYTPQTPEALAA